MHSSRKIKDDIFNDMQMLCIIQLENINFLELRPIYTPYLNGVYIFVHNSNNKMFAYDSFKKKWIEYIEFKKNTM